MAKQKSLTKKQRELLGQCDECVRPKPQRNNWLNPDCVTSSINDLFVQTEGALEEFNGWEDQSHTLWDEQHDAFADEASYSSELLFEEQPSPSDKLQKVYEFVKHADDVVMHSPVLNPYAYQLFTILRWQLICYLRHIYRTIPNCRSDALTRLEQIDQLRNGLLTQAWESYNPYSM